MSASEKFFAAAGDILAAIGGAALAHVFVDGKTEKGINPGFMREQAPHLAKSRADEAHYSRLVTQLKDGHQKALDGFMSRLGEHQQADFIISVCEHSYCATDGDKDANLALTLQFLKMIAEIDDDEERIRVCDARNFIRAKADDYLAVRLQNLLGIHWNNRQGFETWLQDQVPHLVRARNFLGVTHLNAGGTQAAQPQRGFLGSVGYFFSMKRAACRFK